LLYGGAAAFLDRDQPAQTDEPERIRWMSERLKKEEQSFLLCIDSPQLLTEPFLGLIARVISTFLVHRTHDTAPGSGNRHPARAWPVQ
jgi:hypothetical protein